MITVKINNKEYQVDESKTILEAATDNNIRIPTLCYLKGLNEIGSCRMCVVEIAGKNNLVASCVTKPTPNMEIYTDSEKVIKSRKMTLELILSTHNKNCESCKRNGNCELQSLLIEYDIFPKYNSCPSFREDCSTNYIERDNSKCILCSRCVATCKFNQSVSVIGKNERGINTHIGSAFEKNLSDVPCVACGQCTTVCPTGALTEKDDRDKVKKALQNKNLTVIVGVAPSVRFALGEEFDLPIGTNVKGKMVAALKKIGFNKVFDIDYTADLTIMEEGTEFIERLNNKGVLPLISSCSPGWINYVEKFFPEFIPNISSCKSPQEMFGAVIKSYYAEKSNIDPKKLYVVTIMPCTAKKYEASLKKNNNEIDAVLTTRELAKLIKELNIDFNTLTNESFDNPLGYGASVIFGASGGVMECALRTVSEILTNKPLERLEFHEVRGNDGLKEATYNINGRDIRVAAVSGLSNTKNLLIKIKNKEVDYDFIEVMACPGGCLNGGGQPIVSSEIRSKIDVKKERSKSLYEEDKILPVRKAHENKFIKELYDNYLIKPGSEKAHRLLHTTYQKQDKYKK